MSLLPICGKILERLIFNELLEFFIENKPISSSSLVLNRAISVSINCYLILMRYIIFLDIAKAFDKVWHDDMIFKLTHNGISRNLLNLLRDFLNERKQRVILNEQFSARKNVSAGTPQGSILVPLLFLIYTNDLTEDF